MSFARVASLVLSLPLAMFACAHDELRGDWCATDRVRLETASKLRTACSDGDFYACSVAIDECEHGDGAFCDPARVAPSRDTVAIAGCAAREFRDSVFCTDKRLDAVLASDARLPDLYARRCTMSDWTACYAGGLLREHAGDVDAARTAYQKACTHGVGAACARSKVMPASSALVIAPVASSVPQENAVASDPSPMSTAEPEPSSRVLTPYDLKPIARCFGSTTVAPGCVSLHWTVTRKGTVTAPSVEGVDDAPTRRCVTEAMKRWRFEASSDERDLEHDINCSR